MIRYTTDILQALKDKGYTSTRIRGEKMLGQSYLQQIRRGELVSWAAINTICNLLECRLEDILEFVPDLTPETKKDPSGDEPVEG